MFEFSRADIKNGIDRSCETHPARLRFYAELYVEHPPAEVWSYFSDLTKWQTWSPVCRGCRLIDAGAELRLGSILEMKLAVAGISVTVPCRVVQFDPPHTITWQGQKFGIRATHSYRFLPQDEGTLLCNEEIFTGVSFPVNAFMSAWYRASNFSKRSLRGIQRELLKETGTERSGLPTSTHAPVP